MENKNRSGSVPDILNLLCSR